MLQDVSEVVCDAIGYYNVLRNSDVGPIFYFDIVGP